MKKTVILFIAIAFIGSVLISASAFAGKDPKKHRTEKAKTQQCDQNKANNTSAADAKACCHKEGDKGCCAKPGCDKTSGKTCAKACSDSTSRGQEMKACEHHATGASSAKCAKSESCAHKCSASTEAK